MIIPDDTDSTIWLTQGSKQLQSPTFRRSELHFSQEWTTFHRTATRFQQLYDISNIQYLCYYDLSLFFVTF